MDSWVQLISNYKPDVITEFRHVCIWLKDLPVWPDLRYHIACLVVILVWLSNPPRFLFGWAVSVVVVS